MKKSSFQRRKDFANLKNYLISLKEIFYLNDPVKFLEVIIIIIRTLCVLHTSYL